MENWIISLEALLLFPGRVVCPKGVSHCLSVDCLPFRVESYLPLKLFLSARVWNWTIKFAVKLLLVKSFTNYLEITRQNLDVTQTPRGTRRV